MGNMLQIENYPLILTIVGKPGMGKTWQLRSHLETLGFKIFSVNSADLESETAGAPAKLLREQYVNASISISQKNPSALVIDDIDTTLGEWEQNTGTVNHQDILAFFMHIADNPTFIETIGEINRVPIFFTGNNFERLYEPLRRPGRMLKFDWNPNREERVEIISSIFSFTYRSVPEALVDLYPTEAISFFSDLLVSKTVEQLAGIASNAAFKHMLSNPNYKNILIAKFDEQRKNFNWINFTNAMTKEVLGGKQVNENSYK